MGSYQQTVNPMLIDSTDHLAYASGRRDARGGSRLDLFSAQSFRGEFALAGLEEKTQVLGVFIQRDHIANSGTDAAM